MKRGMAVSAAEMPAILTYCTVCSGSDICKEAFVSVSRATKKVGIGKGTKFVQRWACESDP
eukprot:11218988-Lingulodinium_polyedra.AAC.1